MLRLYNTVLLPVRAALVPWSAWLSRTPSGAREWAERWARELPGADPGGLWLHGASVGEAKVVRLVSGRLRHRFPGLPLSVSAYTRTGREQLPVPPEVDASFFMPLDFHGLPSRLFESVRPRAMVLVETELWPNLLREASRLGVPVGVINGRLSPRRMSRYRMLARLYRPLLAGLARIGVQSEEDAGRFVELGASPVRLTVTGNVKYDLPTPDVDPALLRQGFALAPQRPVVVAGSTGEGEEGPVLDAFQEVRNSFPSLFLVLAPRHPERAAQVGRLVAARGLRCHRLSQPDEGMAGRADVLLVDTIGRLASLYSIGQAAFVGGSLVPLGGHNVLEPAALGVPVLFGPHTEHAREPADALLRAGGAQRVDGPASLAERWRELLGDDDLRHRMASRAAGVLASNRGALDRSLAIIDSLLEGRAA